MEQTPDSATPRWSPDRMWWWDGVRWVPANQAPVLPPPPPPPPVPPAYMYMPPAYAFAQPAGGMFAPSPGLRVFLIVMLSIAVVLNGLMSLWGTVTVTGGYNDSGSILFWSIFVALFVLSATGLLGVLRRSRWGRWAALAAGIALTFTCLEAVLGIPIIVAAARAPLRKPGNQVPETLGARAG
jgi:hypothetical protein